MHRFTRCGLWSAGLLVLLVGFGPAAAQPAAVYTLPADTLTAAGTAPRILSLPTRWHYQAGHDPAYATPDYDDTAWPQVYSPLTDTTSWPAWAGQGWFRLQFSSDADLTGQPLALRMQQYGAMEVYLDGQLLYRIGQLEHPYVAALQQAPYVFTLAAPGPHVLAVRYVNPDVQAYHAIRAPAGFWAWVGSAEPYTNYRIAKTRYESTFQWLFTGLFGTVALLHLLLFYFNREATENLFFGLLAGTYAFFAYRFYAPYFATVPDFYIAHNHIMNTTGYVLCLLMLRFVYGLFYPRVPRIFYWVLGLSGVFLVLNYIMPRTDRLTLFPLAFLTSVELVRVVSVALYRRKPGAKILGVGILALSAGLCLIVFGQLGWVSFSWMREGALLGVVFLVVSMSVYLSQKVAETNRNLRHQLERVRTLSDQKLEQERKIRDAEIRRSLLEAEYERKVQELEEARQLQLSMLPNVLPTLPYLDIAAHMQTATEVGGDYYDFDLAPDGVLTLAVGDATGHGMRAGTMVTATKSILNVLGRQPDLLHILERSTRALKRLNFHKLYMALTLAKIEGNTLQVAAAGMPPTLIHRAATGAVEELILKGMPLGCFTDFPYREREATLYPGDTVLVMSDGFAELFNTNGDMLGYDEARDLFGQSVGRSAQDVIDHLLEAAQTWAGGEPPHDDITFVVLKWKAPVTERA